MFSKREKRRTEATSLIAPNSVSVMALLEFMCIKINHGSSSSDCLLKASLQKQWRSSQSLNYYV